MNNVEKIVTVLQKMSYYGPRFLGPIKGLYSNTGGVEADVVVPKLYVGNLLTVLPSERIEDVVQIAVRSIVDSCDGCPTPFAFRMVLAKSALDAYGLNFQSLRSRSIQFCATPPMDSAIATRWVERLLYTLICDLGMQKLRELAEQEFQVAVANIIFSGKQLKSYSKETEKEEIRHSRDLQQLLTKTR